MMEKGSRNRPDLNLSQGDFLSREAGPLQPKVKGVVDLVFLIDISGSMGPCIDALKANIAKFIDVLTGKDANNSNPVKDWRAKIVGYRDVNHDRGAWLEDNLFVSDVGSLKAQLIAMRADGGGDEPESLLDALFKIANMGSSDQDAKSPEPDKWRYIYSAKRVMILFTDASFHPRMSIPEAKGGGITDVGNKLNEQKIQVEAFTPKMACYDDLSIISCLNINDINPDGGDPVSAMAAFTSDVAKFKAVLETLAKTVSKPLPTPAL